MGKNLKEETLQPISLEEWNALSDEQRNDIIQFIRGQSNGDKAKKIQELAFGTMDWEPPIYPEEFIERLGEQVELFIWKWLDDNAPEPIASLLNHYCEMRGNKPGTEGMVYNCMNKRVAESVAEVVGLLSQLGVSVTVESDVLDA
jgi:hypothetical protein